MDHYIVSARKYRPSTFATVVGQRPLTATLKHAIATDRLAHSYLFCGSRGVGKTSCARIFAKTINCTHRTADGEACNECESCRAFNDGNSLNIIELDAASHNGIDDMKALIEQVQVPPVNGRYRVFIIDEVHMLSTAAFNAFLKTLEEPPEHVIFILATTEKHKIIPTILSRCQIYDFSRITIQDMVDHMLYVAGQEGISAEPSALNVIARKADGAMRDALSIFDQVAASSMGNITYQHTIDNLNILDSAYYSRLVEAFLTGNIPDALLIYKEIRDKGFDSQFFINGLGLYMRDLMMAYQPSTLSLVETTDDVKAQMAALARKCPPQFIYKAMDLCNEADLNYRVATNKQFLIELTLVKLCQLCSLSPGNSGDGEGQLKPIIAATPTVSVAQPATAAAPPQPAYQAQAAPRPAAAPAPQAPAAAPAPQAPAAHQPASMPEPRAQAPARSTSKVPKLTLRGVHKPKTEAAPAQQAASSSTNRNQSFTDADFERAWHDYAAAHPTERILVNTMLAALPSRVGDGCVYTLGVYDNIQVEALDEARQSILKHLRDTLANDSIDLQVSIVATEDSPQTWTQRQALEHMIEKQPLLAQLVKDFGLTL